ncbi:MAG TPA: hypothetical protein VGF67_01140 [Ktedonobacteraceae bacterium]|jgi:hypothetical protein
MAQLQAPVDIHLTNPGFSSLYSPCQPDLFGARRRYPGRRQDMTSTTPRVTQTVGSSLRLLWASDNAADGAGATYRGVSSLRVLPRGSIHPAIPQNAIYGSRAGRACHEADTSLRLRSLHPV